jgi:hypothetical protein
MRLTAQFFSVTTALALSWACPPLGAQITPPPVADRHEAAATAMSRELSNLIAAQSSAFARTGAFQWDVWQARFDSLVTLEILEASRSGWSAIALHRGDPGVRCAVVVGTAAPLLNAPRTDDRPYCVAMDGSYVEARGAVPDSTWLFWWQDAALEAAPQQIDCPSLKIPKLPERNDSVYVAFIVGVDGLVEPGRIAVESTGGLDASVAMLMRLSGCVFRPAMLRGMPVRAIMRQWIGLAPSSPGAPPPPEGAPSDPLRRTPATEAMRAALREVAAAQARRHAAGGGYASDVADLKTAGAWGPAIHVVMLSWGASGWSAVAVHDSTGMRCVVAVGDGIPAPALPGTGGEPRCTGPEGDPLADSLPPEKGDGPPEVDPPRRKSCNTRLQFRNNPSRRVLVTLEFVVGLDGMPEPRTLRVLEGTGLVDDAGAVQLLAGCTYHPGRFRGKPIRVLVRQPVFFNARP